MNVDPKDYTLSVTRDSQTFQTVFCLTTRAHTRILHLAPRDSLAVQRDDENRDALRSRRSRASCNKSNICLLALGNPFLFSVYYPGPSVG